MVLLNFGKARRLFGEGGKAFVACEKSGNPVLIFCSVTAISLKRSWVFIRLTKMD